MPWPRPGDVVFRPDDDWWMNACLDFADNWANYARVELTVHADNTRAIKLYESLGFEHEGRLRDFSFREGGYVDALLMGRLSKAMATNV